MAWRLLAQAYASQGKEGEARLASAEMYFAAGSERQATQFALRARPLLDRNSLEWRRAVDIVLASGATTMASNRNIISSPAAVMASSTSISPISSIRSSAPTPTS